MQLAVGSDFNKYTDEGRERLTKLMRVSGRPVIINSVAQTTTNVNGWREVLDWMASMRAEGGKIIGLGNVVPNRREFNLRYTDFFDRYPLWLKLSMEPYEEKLRLLADPAYRARLREDTENVTDTFFLQNPIKWDLVTLVKAKTERWKTVRGDEPAGDRRGPRRPPDRSACSTSRSARISTPSSVRRGTATRTRRRRWRSCGPRT